MNKKTYETPQALLIEMEQCNTLCSSHIEIVDISYQDGVTGGDIEGPGVANSGGDGEDEEIAAKSWDTFDKPL